MTRQAKERPFNGLTMRSLVGRINKRLAAKPPPEFTLRVQVGSGLKLRQKQVGRVLGHHLVDGRNDRCLLPAFDPVTLGEELGLLSPEEAAYLRLTVEEKKRR